MIAGSVGCFAGALAGASAIHFYDKAHDFEPNKITHPREWSVFRRIDRTRKGFATRADIRSLCYRFEAEEHADTLVALLDPNGLDHITFKHFIKHYNNVLTMRKAARLKLWHRCCGIGVAGNVAGHMAQAGEAGQDSKKATKPAGIFTYYMPPHAFEVHDDHVDKSRLEHFPVTNAVIDFPKLPGSSKVQVEPEVGLLVDIVYSDDRKSVRSLVPRRVAAFNDCSIRVLDGSQKLSQRKNWGFGSKGISIRSFPVDSFSQGSFVDHLAIVSYIKREDKLYQYSVTAPARNYLMFHEPLLEWIVERINHQTDSASFEPIFPLLSESDWPTSAWIALGAGEYTEWGATNYIAPKDETVIAVYDERKFPDGPSTSIIESLFDDNSAPEGMVVLHQTFV